MGNQHEFRLILTQFCNYRCFFCHGEGAMDTKIAFLLTPEDYAFIAQVAKQTWGWDTITLTGGEPLISPIYYRICQLLAESGIRITTVTNASLLAKPRQLLRYNAQVNISLHTLNPEVYQQITCFHYPLENVLQTIRQVRLELPGIEIHLNATIMHAYNDRPEDLEALIDFAREVRAVPKFIDLASQDINLIVPVEGIVRILKTLGFKVTETTLWQVKLRRPSDGVETLVTRCGFSEAHQQLELRNLLVYPNGTLSLGLPDVRPLEVLDNIRQRNADGFIRQVASYFPPVN